MGIFGNLSFRCLLTAGIILAASIPSHAQEQGGNNGQGDQRRDGDGRRGDSRRGPPGGGFGFGGGFGSGFGRNSSLLGLLDAPEVKKHLNIDADTSAYIALLEDDINQKNGEFFRANRDLDRDAAREKMMTYFREQAPKTEAQIKEIIGDEKLARLKQVRLQVAGPAIYFFPNSEDGKTLGITDAQREQAGKLMEEAGTQLREIFGPRDGGQRRGEDEVRKMMEEFRSKQEEKYLALLTETQKEKRKEMMGTPIDFTIAPRPRGSFDGRRRGDDNRPRENPSSDSAPKKDQT